MAKSAMTMNALFNGAVLNAMISPFFVLDVCSFLINVKLL